MIQVTATDFRASFGKYLLLVGRDEIHITKNGADVAVLAAPKTKRGWVDDLAGIIPSADVDAKKTKAERLAQK